MADFATADQLSTYMGETVDPARGDMLVGLASDIVRGRLGQVVDLVTDDTVILDPIGDQPLVILPEMPVVSVSAVSVTDASSGVVTVLGTGDYLVDIATGIVSQMPGSTISWWGQVTVTYTHGYDPIPDAIVAATLIVAARIVNMPEGVFSEGIGDYQVRYATGRYATPAGEDPLDIILSAYRNPVVA